MSDLIVIVPTRGRPQAVRQLADAFSVSCTSATRLLIAVDDDDPDLAAYQGAVESARETFPRITLTVQSADCMAAALNVATQWTLENFPDADAIGFMGDDHRPRTHGWDKAYLAALVKQPGIVYGNDLIHGANLPTQFAVSAGIVGALGFLSPEGLRHMYIDNYWRDVGRGAGVLTYLGNVVVEHMHPVASKAEYDEGYLRVNDPAVFDHDRVAYEGYQESGAFARDVEAVKQVVS